MCVQVDPLEKILKEQLYFEENADTAAVAKGETATFQFVLRSIYPVSNLRVEVGDLVNNNHRIAASLKAFVGYIRAGRSTPNPSNDRLLSASGYYPDCLQEIESIDMPSMSNQPVWIGYAVPRDASAGTYSTTLVFTGTTNGKPFIIKKQVTAKVYNVVLPEQTLKVTNWWFADKLSLMNNNEPVEPFSDRYWELLTVLAHSMRDHGQNIYLIPLYSQNPLSMFCKYELSGTKWSFDFTNFDKTVELFIREGGLKYIEGGHLGSRLNGNWNDTEFGIQIPKSGLRSLDNDTTRNFLSQFIPALYSHLEGKGWISMYLQHIVDEPIIENAQSYIRIAEFVKKRMPNVRLIEAVHSHQLENSIQIWVPQLNFYHRDYSFYQERQAAGDETWFYTCLGPQGNYANRFLELPLVQTRILHWINYRYKATGYLHWGFNYWNSNIKDNMSSFAGGLLLPAGDSWIVYPAYGKVYSSIRLEAMRDGIADYELLKLLEQKSPEKANEVARAVVNNFDIYDNHIPTFRAKRIKMLTWLSE
jgi:hypothetical protein